MGGSNNYASGAVELHVVFGWRVVETHSLKGDANEVWVYCAEHFSHLLRVDAATAAALLGFFLKAN